MAVECAEAEQITAASGSNLALALWVLPESVRRDMRVFYAFCRVVDDLADEPGLPRLTRAQGLKMWMEAVLSPVRVAGEPALAADLRRVLAKREISTELVCEIIRGCEMDLEGARYRNWEELKGYCYRVASAVGLVSAQIFGGRGCERYAEDLGLALQLTNILRDSAEDYANEGRVYLPQDEMQAAGVLEGSWVREDPRGWSDLMRLQSERTVLFYASAESALPDSERRVMVAAEIMREIYGGIFSEMVTDGFRVWERRYSLSKSRKLWVMISVFLKACWHG